MFRNIALLTAILVLPHSATAENTSALQCWIQAQEYYKEKSQDEIISDSSPLQQWMFSANSSGVVLLSEPKSTPNSSPIGYSLKNKSRRRFLQYEKQDYGINLGWTKNASAQTEQASQGFAVTPPYNDRILRYGSVVALSWGQMSKPYLRYKKRKWGINLSWERNPSYEWKVLGGAEGSPVRQGKDWVILFNMTHAEPMLFFKRKRGGNIGWPDSKNWSPWWEPSFSTTIQGTNTCEKYMARAAARILAKVPVVQ